MLRLPRRLLETAVALRYRAGESLRVRPTATQVILAFRSEAETGADSEDDDGDGWISALLPLRAELASGDHRGLYLGWLGGAQALELEDEALDPAVPCGLGTLSTAQQALASLMRLNGNLIRVAAEASPSLRPPLSRQAIHTWVLGLADSEKAELLVRLVADDDPHRLHSELVQRAQQATGSEAGHVIGPGRGRRTVQQLLAGAAQRTEVHTRAAAERAEQERQRQDRERATARAAYLDSLVGRVDEEWQRVEALVATRLPTDYDEAVQVLRDLRDLAARGGRFNSFVARFEQVRARHAKKVSLLERFERARLLPQQPAASGRGAREV